MVSVKSEIRLGVVLATMVLGGAALAQTPKGDLWETTSQMSMEGMPMKMPAQTVKVCTAKEWTQPPGDQRNCKTSNFKKTDNKVTWDMQCTGPAMSGTGEILRNGADAYSGTIKFAAEQGKMTVTLTGRRLGDCDNPQ